MVNRQKRIIRVSLIGVATNILLAGFKLLVGVVSGSIAIILDAVNNLTDVCSSVVTIVGAKLAGRLRDSEHPYGHGRSEYLAAMVVGLIVFLAGVMALTEAVPKIFSPELADYSWATITVVTAAVAVKIILGQYTKRAGEKLDSTSLVASGIDAMFDALISLATLVGIAVTMAFRVSIDGLLGVVIAALIIKTSLEILGEAAADILGRGVDPDLAHQIRELVRGFPGVKGAYDLDIHNYGPAEYVGSVYIEVADRMTAGEIDQLSRRIVEQVRRKYQVDLTVGIYAENSDTKVRRQVRRRLEQLVAEHAEVRQMHGFYIDEKTKVVAFDLIIDCRCAEPARLKDLLVRELKREYPGFRYQVKLDLDREKHED